MGGRDTCEREGDTHCKPQRGLLMPAALSEVGSISMRVEHDLLASDAGQQAVADGLFDGFAEYFAERPLAARIALADDPSLDIPEPVPGTGPMFWPQVVPDGPIQLRLTNTGTESWPDRSGLVASWEATEMPYLARPPEDLEPIDAEIPALAPGESVVVTVDLPPNSSEGRSVAWISLLAGRATLADRGSPALQLSTGAP